MKARCSKCSREENTLPKIHNIFGFRVTRGVLYAKPFCKVCTKIERGSIKTCKMCSGQVKLKTNAQKTDFCTPMCKKTFKDIGRLRQRIAINEANNRRYVERILNFKKEFDVGDEPVHPSEKKIVKSIPIDIFQGCTETQKVIIKHMVKSIGLSPMGFSALPDGTVYYMGTQVA